MARAHHWQTRLLNDGPLPLVAMMPDTPPRSSRLTVYIEGDGMAWRTSSLPSDNPTPKDPLALTLALEHPDGASAYLARPCQQVDTRKYPACQFPLWTAERFSPAVIDVSNKGIDSLKQIYSAREIVLVGYSGGGAIAALLAARRKDVIKLITIAGNLDPDAWTQLHHLQPLSGSLNPAHEIGQLRNIPQLHWTGETDKVIPPSLAKDFSLKFPPEHRPEVRVVPGFDHHCCWAAQWKALSKETFSP